MKKALVLISIVFVLVLMIKLVSAHHSYYYYPKYKTDSHKEVIEYKHTTEDSYKDYWNSEKVKTTVTQKTEIKRTNKKPDYSYYDYHKPYYYGYHYVPYSSWRYKEQYNYYRYKDSDERDYYYKPRYDYSLGYYNWRY